MLPGDGSPHAAGLLGRHLRPGAGHLPRTIAWVTLLFACGRSEPWTPPAHAGPWRCSGASCTQRVPELPDDGEWECADVDGVVVCRGGGAAAGIVAGGGARGGWTCGDRRGQDAGRERICVQASPDLPGGATSGWRCFFQHSPERRVCERDPAAPAVRAPATSRAECWLDADCGGARCLFGSCR